MSYRPIGAGDFFQLFTFTERAAIKNSTDPLVESFWDSYQTAIATNAKIDLGSPDVALGLSYLSATNVMPPAATGWQPSTAYTAGQQASLGGNTYTVTTPGTSAASGGPAGTGGGIVDGSVTWAYTPTPYLAEGRSAQILNLVVQ